MLTSPRFLWSLAVTLAALTPGVDAQTQTVTYELQDVWLTPSWGSPRQLTGSFEWTYTLGDFENGSGEMLAVGMPWFGLGPEWVAGNFDVGTLEYTMIGNWHDYGVDVSLKLAQDLSPDNPSAIDLVNSKFDIENLGVGHSGVITSGSVVPLIENDAWVDIGGALAGTNGEPLLTGLGPLTPSSPVSLVLVDAKPSAAAALVVGVVLLNAPFKGGLLVPDPLLIVPGFVTAADGSLTLDATWPAGIPAGLASHYQWWITDPDGPVGFAASNGVTGTTP